MQNRFIKFRQQAIEWLNGKRDFEAGIKLLEDSRFKPGVVAKLKRHGANGPDAASRLKFLMRELIRAWTLPEGQEPEDVDADTGLTASDKTEEGHDDASSLRLVDAAGLMEKGEEQFPVNISAVIREYAAAYKRRDMLHKQLADVPEDNDTATMQLRENLIKEIAALTDQMERLYPLYEKYLADGCDASDEQMKSLEADTQAATPQDRNAAGTDYASMSKEELQKLRKSVATKIGRARNMLEYRQETRKEVPDPMPESPKRVKYETKIATLGIELEKIDYAIAALG